jgi:hypothetical protein
LIPPQGFAGEVFSLGASAVPGHRAKALFQLLRNPPPLDGDARIIVRSIFKGR